MRLLKKISQWLQVPFEWIILVLYLLTRYPFFFSDKHAMQEMCYNTIMVMVMTIKKSTYYIVKGIVRRKYVTCTKICSDTNNESLSYIIIVGRDCMCIEK